MSEAKAARLIDRSRHRLLVVNDDPVGRYTTVRLLNAAGFPTLEASTGAEALAIADDALSAVVLDIHLPDIDGFELCRRLRARPNTFRLPVIHLTAAYLTDEDKVRGLDAGADAYLTHPVEPAVLVSTIQALVRTRAAEDAMRRSEAKFRAVYALAPNGICLLRAGGGAVLEANPAMLALLGREEHEVLGRPLTDFVAEAHRPDALAFIAALGHDGLRAQFPLLPPPRGDGDTEVPGPVQVEWTASTPIEPGLCMATAVDVSQRLVIARQRQELLDRERSARGEAERLSRMKDDLIAVLSHELRTPLNAIMGWTHVLQRHSPPDLLHKGLTAIDRNVSIQARMIADILDMSRLNVGKLPLTRERVEAGSVARAAAAALQHTLADSGHRLELDLRDEEVALLADGGRLQQVIWNLVGNAAKFSPRGSTITLSLRAHDGGASVEVRDEGQGIAPEFLPHIFDRFTQSDATSNRQHGGLGLGLAIVKSLVEAHGGWVDVRSDGPGRGTAISFWLPGAEQAPALVDGDTGPGGVSAFGALGDEGGAPVALGGMRVLVVDDDADAGAMLKLILAERGVRVTTVTSADEALLALAGKVFDLLVSDIGMPGRDGYELIRDIRALEAPGEHLPAIALTAFSRDIDRQQALQAGFDAHLAKPLRPQLLMRLVEQVATTPAS
ncbi:MAG: response regulator [Mitsuaria chitosanitabida]|uniref:hybrid sensor histidine kinase/response regulator n=1 Tax=Roseateles chitosanitabidus TaxID=65048 RepID=UPI001B0E1B94|nr:response regulator [Roseateles chitosanitabidus]MBO9687830.1 response regulator [Roseateles chitosanitabidus]